MKHSRILAALAAALVLALGLLLSQQGDVSAASLSTSIQLVVKPTLTQTAGLAEVTAPLVFQRAMTWTNGASANQASKVWSSQRTLAASGTEDIDLAGGALVDAFGAAFEPTKVRLLAVYASPANTNSVVILGDAASVPFLSTAATTVSVPPGGLYLQVVPSLAGIAVTATSADIIQVANGGAGTSVTYDILVVGS